MGFLSSAWHAITKIAEAPIKGMESIDPLAKPVAKMVGMKDAPLTSFVNQLHRSARDQYGQMALPIAGGIVGGIFGGPYGAAGGAAAGRAIAGAERNESDTGIAKGAAVTGVASAAGMGAAGGAAGMGAGAFGQGVAGGAASGAAGAGASGWAYGRPAGETFSNMGRGAAIGGATGGIGAGYGGDQIYNSEPGTDFSGSLWSQQGSPMAANAAGTGANMLWKPYQTIAQAPLQNNPYVQMGQQASNPYEYNPYGDLKNFGLKANTPTSKENLINTRLAQRKSTYNQLFS